MLHPDYLPGGRDSSDKGQRPEKAEAPFLRTKPPYIASFYIDGFNL